MTGYVYAVECMGRIKIGHTVQPPARLVTLNTYAPAPVRLLGAKPGKRSDEAALHKLLAADRVHGEWFFATEAVLSAVADMKPIEQVEFTARSHVDLSTARRLTAERRKAGLSQTKLAERLGCTKFVICRLEGGKHLPSPHVAASIERSLGIPAAAWVPVRAAA